MNKKNTILIRVLAVLLLVVVAGVMLVIGRGHTVYFDCKDQEYNGTIYESPYKVEVSVKGERVAKLYSGERGMTTWIGQNFKMSLEITEKKGGDSVVRELDLKLPYGMDGVILNLPALLADLPEDAYLTEFIPTVVEEPDSSEGNSDEFGGMEGMEGMEEMGDL